MESFVASAHHVCMYRTQQPERAGSTFIKGAIFFVRQTGGKAAVLYSLVRPHPRAFSPASTPPILASSSFRGPRFPPPSFSPLSSSPPRTLHLKRKLPSPIFLPFLSSPLLPTPGSHLLIPLFSLPSPVFPFQQAQFRMRCTSEHMGRKTGDGRWGGRRGI